MNNIVHGSSSGAALNVVVGFSSPFVWMQTLAPSSMHLTSPFTILGSGAPMPHLDMGAPTVSGLYSE